MVWRSESTSSGGEYRGSKEREAPSRGAGGRDEAALGGDRCLPNQSRRRRAKLVCAAPKSSR